MATYRKGEMDSTKTSIITLWLVIMHGLSYHQWDSHPTGLIFQLLGALGTKVCPVQGFQSCLCCLVLFCCLGSTSLWKSGSTRTDSRFCSKTRCWLEDRYVLCQELGWCLLENRRKAPVHPPVSQGTHSCPAQCSPET